MLGPPGSTGNSSSPASLASVPPTSRADSSNAPALQERSACPGAQRTLLVGTVRSVSQLRALLQSAEPEATILGCALAHVSDAAEPGEALPVLGDFHDLPAILARERPERVLVSLPAALGQTLRELAGELERSAAIWHFIPTMEDQLAGRCVLRGMGPLSASSPHIDFSTLIARRPRPLDTAAIARVIEGRTALITGAGGSIGSELARIVGRFGPARLILVERSENSLFEIDREIARLYPNLVRKAVLHDVANASGTTTLLLEQRPQVVFHAAAHKHVPMMEDHPAEALENNLYGTRSIADAARAAGAERFVMISTDKAVNPSSIMGATKRLAELYIHHLAARSATIYCMVRFGNVLGSACSVLPIWQQQLARGGPLTVTDPRMTRYFMTIPEAASLVLQSACYSRGGEVFLLDMGQPIRILDLARRFIESQGLKPEVDIPIRITGIRPGEKLFEELAYESEEMLPTPHPAIRIWRTSPVAAARVQEMIATFDRLRHKRDPDGHLWQHAGREAIVTAIHAAIPEMARPAARAIAG